MNSMRSEGSSKNEWRILLSIVLGALGVRLLLMVYLQAYVIDNDWAFGYEAGSIAKSIASGEGFSSPFAEPSGPTAWLMPLYPYLLSLIFKVFGVYTTKSAVAALTVNCLFSALTCIPLYHIVRVVFGRGVGYVAALGLAFYPPSIWHAINTIWDTTIFTFLAMFLISLLLLLPERLDLKNTALCGVFTGFIALVNPVILAIYPFVLIWLVLQRTVKREKKMKYVAIICVLVVVVLLPWLLRNYAVFARPMLRSNLGLELKLGNSGRTWNALEATDGQSIAGWRLGHPSTDHGEFLVYGRLGEVKYIDQCQEEALAFIRGNPGKFLSLTFRRMSYFWLGHLSTSNEWGGNLRMSFSISALKKLCHVIPLPFMVIGIFLAAKRRLRIGLLLIFMFFIPLVYYVTHVSERYRYPVEPIILVFAVYGFYSLVEMVKNRVISPETGAQLSSPVG